MSETEIGAPLSVHRPFHESGAQEKALFGAFGSGKTYAGVDEAIVWMLEQPGIRGLGARFTIPELRDTLEPIFMERIPGALRDHCEVRRDGGHIQSVVFPNGSTILFRGLDDPQKHRSLNLGFMLIDEANEVDEETYMFMRGRLRQRDPTEAAVRRGYTDPITRRGSWILTNPSGRDWIYKRFVGDKRKAGTEYFTSTSLDNPFLPPDYIESLLQFPEPWVRRYVLCSFDEFAGQVYEDWSRATYPEGNTVEPYPVPAGATVWQGMDPGTRSPTASVWVHVDYDRRRLVAFEEYQQTGLAATAHANAWRAIEARHRVQPTWRVSDPGSVTVRDRGSNMTLQDMYRREGFNFALGPKLPAERVPMLGLLIAQRRFVVMKGKCPITEEQVEGYRWEDLSLAMRKKGQDAPEKPVKGDDHLVDCAQYLSSRMVPPPNRIKPPAGETFSDLIWGRVRQQKARAVRRHEDRGVTGLPG